MRPTRVTPGHEYEAHNIASLSAQTLKKARANKNPNSFYFKWSQMDKVCHEGMDEHYYLRESPAVGTYE